MLRQCLEVFKHEYEKNPSMIMSGYTPKDGRYVLVQMSGGVSEWKVISEIDIKYDKKEKIVIGESEEYYPLVKELDYYSNLLEMNKPIDPKKAVHSSNYYSFSFKKSIINTKIDDEAIKRYFSVLKNPKLKYKDKNSRDLYENNEEKLGVVNADEVEQIESWVIKNIRNFDIDEKEKDYFKFLFVYPDETKTLEAFKREQLRYEGTNIFNSNKYNILKDGVVYGLSNNNMGLNAKKPYLANLDRHTPEPYLISVEEAMQQKHFFDYLQSVVSNKYYKIYIDTDNKRISLNNVPRVGLQLNLVPDRNEIGIIGYKKYVSDEIDLDISIRKHIDPSFHKSKEDEEKTKNLEVYRRYIKRKEFFEVIDFVFFYNFLINNEYQLEEVKIKEVQLRQILIGYGYGFINWKNFNKTDYLVNTLERLIKDSIVYSLSKGYYRKAAQQFNVGVSLLEYFDKFKEDAVLDIRKIIKKKIISKDDYLIESDEEALFATGQVMSYLLSQTNTKNKNMTFIQNMLYKRDGEKIVEELIMMMKRYKHIFSKSSVRVNLLASKILQYSFKDSSKVNDKWLIAGFLDECFIFTKAEKENPDTKYDTTKDNTTEEIESIH